jgi:hypothetical protein
MFPLAFLWKWLAGQTLLALGRGLL